MRQPVVAVVPEPDAAAGTPPEQPVKRGGGNGAKPAAVDGIQSSGGLGNGVLKLGGGLGGGRAHGDPRHPPGVDLVLLGDQRQQAGHRGGLAGAGTAGEDGDPAPRRGLRHRTLLLVALAVEGPVETSLQGRLVERRCLPGQSGEEVVADVALLAPVAVEVQPALVQAQGGLGDERALRDPIGPAGRFGPRQCDVLLRRDVGDGGEVDAHRSVADGADGQSDGEPDVGALDAQKRAHPGGHVHVGRRQDVGAIELGQQPGGLQREPAVVRIVDHETTSLAAPAMSSDSSTTMAAGGCHEKTPQGWPSISGVSGPHMPRT